MLRSIVVPMFVRLVLASSKKATCATNGDDAAAMDGGALLQVERNVVQEVRSELETSQVGPMMLDWTPWPPNECSFGHALKSFLDEPNKWTSHEKASILAFAKSRACTSDDAILGSWRKRCCHDHVSLLDTSQPSSSSISCTIAGMAWKVESGYTPPQDVTPSDWTSHTPVAIQRADESEDEYCPSLYAGFQRIAPILEAENSGKWREVWFLSRPDPDDRLQQFNITADYYDAGSPDSPTIVISHGTGMNKRDDATMLKASILRMSGFNVLVPTLRDHRGSTALDSNFHETSSWGHHERYDLWGAWDWLKETYNVRTEDTGVVGISQGGHIVAPLFFMNKSIRALWVDSAVFDLKEIFDSGIREQLPALGWLLSWIFTDNAFSCFEKRTDYAIDESPGSMLEQIRDDARPVLVTSDVHDHVVPHAQYTMWTERLEQAGYTITNEAYDFSGKVGDEEKCPNRHLKYAYVMPSEFALKVCTFWRGAFGLPDGDLCSSVSSRFSA